MKKIILSLLLTITLILSACNSGPSYDERGLVPEECQHLDNLEAWQPVWCDEFDEDGLPSSDHWAYDVGGHGWGNRELQYYTERNLNNAFVEDGTLHIRAIKESYQGSDYTSARLVSKYYGDWEYGRIQVKAMLPSGRGTWPAIWMLPSEWRYGGWPDSGEIDIMEYVGYDPEVVHGTIHTAAYNHMHGTQLGFSLDVPTAETEFHIYEMIWEPGKIDLFIDGEPFAYFAFNPQANIGRENYEAWPFDQPFHLILNLAIGGDWGGQQGVDAEAFPTEMKVEYVRVYQKDYAGMSQSAPTKVGRIEMAASSHDSVRIHWEKATHDVMVHYYEIYLDGVLLGDTTLNAFNIDDLEAATSYEIGIVAVDFAGHRSEMATHNVQTASTP